MTVVFLKLQLKNSQISHFWSQTQIFLFFHKFLQLYKFESADFKYENNSFKIVAENYKVMGFLMKNTQITYFCAKFRHFCFCAKFYSQTNWRKLISNITIFFSNSSPKYQIKNFQFQIQSLLFLHKILQLDKFKSFDLKHDNSQPNKRFFVQNLGIFVFSQNLAIRQI